MATEAFALLSLSGHLTLPVTMLLATLYGVSFVLQMTLRSTLVPSLVAPHDLLNAVSLSQVGTQGAEFIGPALTTPFLVAGGPAMAWTVCAVLYTAATLLILPIGPARAMPAGAARRPTRMLDSFRYFGVRPLALTAICAVALHCALTMAYQGMLPMFVSNASQRRQLELRRAPHLDRVGGGGRQPAAGRPGDRAPPRPDLPRQPVGERPLPRVRWPSRGTT